MGGGYPIRSTAPYFGSATIPVCAVAMNSPGYFTPEASMIDVPVFIGVGERDVSPNPWIEPSAYWNSKDVSLYVVPHMAHMHNFASTRQLLWQRSANGARSFRRTPGLQDRRSTGWMVEPGTTVTPPIAAPVSEFDYISSVPARPVVSLRTGCRRIRNQVLLIEAGPPDASPLVRIPKGFGNF